LLHNATTSLEEFRQAQTAIPKVAPSLPLTVRWQKPPLGVIKVNWDAALDHSSKVIGVGAIARDEKGGTVASYCSIVPFVTDPTVAEAVAAWKTIGFCCDQGFSHLILEGDALEIVHGLNKDSSSWCRYGQLLSDSRECLTRFESWRVTHVRREGNAAAHCLAKFAIQHSLNRVWQGTNPYVIQSIVLAEQASP
jgi:ribonuclease HI